MTTLTEGRHLGEFVVSEANGCRSRESVTVASGSTLTVGMVVGVVTASGKYEQLDTGAADGTEAAAGVIYNDVDASAADATGVAIVRDAELNADEIVWPDGISGGDQTTAINELAALGIILR